MRWLDGITYIMNMILGSLWEMVRDRKAWHAAVYGVTKSQMWLGDSTTTDVSNGLAIYGPCHVEICSFYTLFLREF